MFSFHTGVTVTPPVLRLPVTVKETVVVRVRLTHTGDRHRCCSQRCRARGGKRQRAAIPVGAPGLNAAVTPAGSPLALNVTPPVKWSA